MDTISCLCFITPDSCHIDMFHHFHVAGYEFFFFCVAYYYLTPIFPDVSYCPPQYVSMSMLCYCFGVGVSILCVAYYFPPQSQCTSSIVKSCYCFYIRPFMRVDAHGTLINVSIDCLMIILKRVLDDTCLY